MSTTVKRGNSEEMAEAGDGKKLKSGDGTDEAEKDGNASAGGEMKWQLTKTDASQRLEYLRKSGDFSDSSVIVGTGDGVETIKVHRTVLCMSSTKFEEIFAEHDKDQPIHICDVEPRIFHLLLDYMYLDKPIIKSSEDACLLFKAAVAYQMPHLCQISANVLSKSLNLENIWMVLRLVAETREPSLTAECGKFVRKHPMAILHHENFVKVDGNVVNMVAELDCLDIPEIDVINAVDKWAEHQCSLMNVPADRDGKRAAIGSDIMKKLRFLALSKEQFVDKIAYKVENSAHCLLSLEESYSIIMNISVPNCYPLPEGFTNDNKPRKVARLRCVRKIQAITSSPNYPLYTNPPFGSPTSFPGSGVVALPNPAHNGNLGGKNFSLDIKVDYPITLYGVQVPSLLYPMQGASHSTKEYDESFIVTVIDSSGSPVSHTVYTGKVPYGGSIDINLKDAVTLQKNVPYKIQVYTSHTYFLSRKLCIMEHCPPVRFYFKDVAKVGPASSNHLFPTSNVKQDTDSGFITQIIYSLWS